MSLATLISSIGHFFANLFKTTQNAFNELPKEQQDAIVKGVNISQLLKDGYKSGEAAIISSVATKLNVSTDVATGVVLHVLNSIPGINTTTIQAGLDKLADNIQTGITDDGWNGLWETVAKAGASFLATGSLNWVTLGLGVVEFAFQHFIKGVK